MKVIVFGGSGFLGLPVVRQLIESGHQVTVFDRKAPPSNVGAKFVNGDILDEKACLAATDGHSAVYNFAGWADLDTSIHHPVDVIRQNVLGNTIILEAARKAGAKRYVYASSMYVFSKAGSFYRASKQACELIIEEYQRQYGLDFTILRFGSLYGPGATDGNAIFELVKQAITENRICYWGTGEELRQYIHISDAAAGAVDILDESFRNQYVILTGSEDIRLKDLLEMINEMFGKKLEISYDTKPKGEFHYKITPYSFSPKLGKKLLFRTYTDLGQGLLQCIQEMHERLHGSAIDPSGIIRVQTIEK